MGSRLRLDIGNVVAGAERRSSPIQYLPSRSDIDKNMLEVWGPPPDPMQFPEADEVAVAVAQALFEPNPKRRYLAIPRNARDRMNPRLPERLIRYQMKQLVRWNEGHAYTFDRDTLVRMLDEALVGARPRTE